MSINRRELFRMSGATAAGLALAGSGIRLASAERANPDYRADLSGNENPYGPAPAVAEAVREAVDTTNRYGYARQKQLAQQIAAYEGVTVEHIVLGAGSTEVLNASTLAFTGLEKHVLTSEQSYGAIPRYAAAIGTEVFYTPVDEQLRFDLNAIDRKMKTTTGLVYICNPNNPTGTVVDSDKLRDFCSSAATQSMVLVDEAYLEFTDNFRRDSMVDLVRQGHNVIICRTFSKIHGLAGIRMGYSIAKPEISRQINSHKMCMFMGPLGSVAASVSLEQSEFHDFCRAKVKEGRELVFGLCDELGLEYARGAGNFVFFNPHMAHDEFRAAMRARGVDTARPFAPRRDWARVTMGTTEEMKVFAAALREVVPAE